MKRLKRTNYFKNNKHSIRFGTKVPTDKVNLAFVQTPNVEVKDAMTMTDESSISENVIPEEHRKSLMIANEKGILEYINYFGGNKFKRRDPGQIIPSDDIAIAKRFYRDEVAVKNALFYKIEIDYHYDSLSYSYNQNEKLIEYQGDQIQVLDEFDKKIDDENDLIYEIFVIPQQKNNKIVKAVIYLSKRTDKYNTFKVKYNHVDDDSDDSNIASQIGKIQLYSGDKNKVKITLGNTVVTKSMLESGKVRIINPLNIYQEDTLANVNKERALQGKKKEIFHLSEHSSKKGYQITVPEVTMEDKRKTYTFSYRITAEYEDSKGRSHKYSSGLITDTIMHPGTVLPHEEREYMGKLKRLGIPKNEGYVNSVREMLNLSLPNGINSIPDDARLYIEDVKGSPLYYITVLNDDPLTDSTISLEYAYAENHSIPYEKWEHSEDVQYIYENKKIESRFSIIPEHQRKEWEFEFEIDGEGYTEEEVKIQGTWQIGASIKEKSFFETNDLDVANKNLWKAIGAAYRREADGSLVPIDPIHRWAIKEDKKTGRSGLTYLENTEDVMGFYQYQRYDGSKLVSTMNDKDYEFSTRVRMNDLVDDDAVAVLFRVRNSREYYMFTWEKDVISTVPIDYVKFHPEESKELPNYVGPHKEIRQGMGRVNFTEKGYQAIKLFPDIKDSAVYELLLKDKNKYLQAGFGSKHKRIFKASRSPYSTRAKDEKDYVKNPNQRYPQDNTQVAFKDVTLLDSPNYNPKGWIPQKDYKITVVVRGPNFQVYINENAASKEKGQLVCEGYDETYKEGPYGIATISQRWTYWDKLRVEEIDDIVLYSDEYPHTFDSKKMEKMTEQSASEIMQNKIDDFMNKPENKGKEFFINGFIGHQTATTISTVDGETIYAKPNNHMIESIKKIPWYASSNGVSVRGKGKVNYHEDGYLDIDYSPTSVGDGLIPDEVLDFKWKQPVITKGDHIKVVLTDQGYILAEAEVPGIERVGKIYHSKIHELSKDDYVHVVEDLFKNKDDMRKLFQIPDNIPLKDIMLRLEKGRVTNVASNGNTSSAEVNPHVNYRFKTEKNGQYKFPIDQHPDELGKNRLRLSMLLDLSGEQISGYQTSVVAWTEYSEVTAFPLFAINVHEDRRITIEMPRVENETQDERGWFPRVKTGELRKRILLPIETSNPLYKRVPGLTSYAGKEVEAVYRISEKIQTEMNTDERIFIKNEIPKVVGEKELKLKHDNLYLHPNKNIQSVFASIQRGDQVEDLTISDIDKMKGIIYLNESIEESDVIYVSYFYNERYFTYKGFENNQDQFFNLDFNPREGHKYGVRGSEIGKDILYQEEGNNLSLQQRDSRELMARTTYLYLLPAEFRDPITNGLIVSTVYKNQIRHTFEYSRFDNENINYDPTLLLLSRINTGYNYKARESSILLDTRQRGGGIKKHISKRQIEKISQDALSNWDIGHWDGEAYQENGIVLIRINDKVIKGKKESDVRNFIDGILSKYKAHGIYPIVEFYNERFGTSRSILRNEEFLLGQHVSNYIPYLSKGKCEIIKDEVEDYESYRLSLLSRSNYFIRVPGYHFEAGQRYDFKVQAKRASGSPNREAFSLIIEYKDGAIEERKAQLITNVELWNEFTVTISPKREIKRVDFILGTENLLNESGQYFYNKVYISPRGI